MRSQHFEPFVNPATNETVAGKKAVFKATSEGDEVKSYVKVANETIAADEDPAQMVAKEEALEEYEEDAQVAEHVEDARVVKRHEVAADVESANGEATDRHAELLFSELKQVRKNKVKKRKQLPINMDDSDYNLDSLIFWCTSLKMLLRATAYLLRAVGRRFLRRGEIDSSEYYINQGEVSHSESDDAWDS